MIRFADRVDAGRQLAGRLEAFKDQDCVVLALPRGGLPVAFEVARALDAPLDLIMVRKIGAPWQHELAIAAIVDGEHPQLVINEEITAELGVSDAYLQQAAGEELAEIERRRTLYFGHAQRQPVTGRTVLIVDDGIATGATMRAAVKAMRQAGAKRIVVAAPVAGEEAIRHLREEADEVICLEDRLDYGAIGAYYDDFPQLTDAEVITILDEAGKAGRDGTASA